MLGNPGGNAGSDRLMFSGMPMLGSDGSAGSCGTGILGRPGGNVGKLRLSRSGMPMFGSAGSVGSCSDGIDGIPGGNAGSESAGRLHKLKEPSLPSSPATGARSSLTHLP